MKNVWKGLVVGGLTGVAAGLALDILNRGAREVSAFGGKVGHQAPDTVGRIRHAVSDAIAESTESLRKSEAVDQLSEATNRTREKAASVTP